MPTELRKDRYRIEILESHSESRFVDGLQVSRITCLRDLPGRRSVWSVQSEYGKLLLKIFHPHPKQESDARLEWKNGTSLNRLNLSSADALFYGLGEGGALVVGYQLIENAQTLDQALRVATKEERKKLFESLLKLHDAQHRSGCYQSDDHLGNYLWGEGKLWMLDAGSCHFSSMPLDENRRVKNMAMLEANIPVGWIAEYRRALKRAYSFSMKMSDEVRRSAVQKRLFDYLRKTQRSCTQFEEKSTWDSRWLAQRDISPTLKKNLLTSPDKYFEKSDKPLLKDGNTCSVVEIEEDGKKYVLKRYNQKPFLYRLRHMMMKPRALLSWSHGHVLSMFGVPTPRPVVCLIKKWGPLMQKAYLLMESIDGESLLDQPKEKMTDSTQNLPRQFASRWCELEYLGATHGDMKGTNFMVTDDDAIVIIDLDGFKFHKRASEEKARRAKDLKRFMKNWDDEKVQKAYLEALKKKSKEFFA